VKRVALGGGAVLLVAFLAIQLVPYGWEHPNPPVVAEPAWPDAEAEELARTACYSCHSNETDWPLYSYVAPMSWLVRQDVERGRDELNFSEWDGDADDAADAIADGSMPPNRYTLIHRNADLSADEEQRLIAALDQLEEQDGGGGRGRGRGRGRGGGGDG
jgi:Haem-binding domain